VNHCTHDRVRAWPYCMSTNKPRFLSSIPSIVDTSDSLIHSPQICLSLSQIAWFPIADMVQVAVELVQNVAVREMRWWEVPSSCWTCNQIPVKFTEVQVQIQVQDQMVAALWHWCHLQYKVWFVCRWCRMIQELNHYVWWLWAWASLGDALWRWIRAPFVALLVDHWNHIHLVHQL
jgi:hypothetical protein